MDSSHCQFRAVLLADFLRGVSCQESHKNLIEAYGRDAPSIHTVRRWFAKFRRGQRSLEDDHRSGRPATAVTPKNMQRVEELIRERRNVTHREIQRQCGIGAAAVNSILHHQLGARKLASRWIPHLLSNDQKRTRVKWCREMLKKDRNVYPKSSQVTRRGYTRTTRKRSSNRPFGYSEMSHHRPRSSETRAFRSKWSPFFSDAKARSQWCPCGNGGRSMPIGIPPFACQPYLGNWNGSVRKPDYGEFSFTTTTRQLTLPRKRFRFWTRRTSNWSGTRRIVQTWLRAIFSYFRN